MKLEKKVALITGSTGGIGRACAELFAQQGASVVINGYPTEAGYKVVDQIQQQGGQAAYCEADVGSRDDVKQLVQFALDTYGQIDILMNNAVDGKNSELLQQEEAEWDRVFDTSIKAVFRACKLVIPHMIDHGGGAIINTSSVHGLLAGNGSPAYDAAKAAIINLTRQLAVEYGRHGVRVNALCPGRILTEDKRKWLETRPDELRRQKIVYPLGRAGEPEEVARVALFLASEDASFITGHALVVDGGLTAQLQDAVAARVDPS